MAERIKAHGFDSRQVNLAGLGFNQPVGRFNWYISKNIIHKKSRKDVKNENY